MDIGITLTNKDLYYFSLAEKVSQLSDYPRINIGAVIVHKNRIISFGRNQVKTHRIQKEYNKHRGFELKSDFIHAEISAIINSKMEDLSGCKIYIFRRLRNGDLGNCKPCPACLQALVDRRVEEVYYTIENGFERLYISRERMVG